MEFIHTYYGTPVYEYHQITTKTYSYVGMDYKTALKCRDAMYLRYRKVYTVFNNQYLAFAP